MALCWGHPVPCKAVGLRPTWLGEPMPMHGPPTLQGTTLDSQTECRTMEPENTVSRIVPSGAVCQESKAREGSRVLSKVTHIRRAETESKGSPLRVKGAGSFSRAYLSGFDISSEDKNGPPHPESQHNPSSGQMKSFHHEAVCELLLHLPRWP